jgi:hypothetical protein
MELSISVQVLHPHPLWPSSTFLPHQEQLQPQGLVPSSGRSGDDDLKVKAISISGMCMFNASGPA